MIKSNQESLKVIISDALDNNPDLREAIQLYQYSLDQYSEALSRMEVVKIISTNTTNLEGNHAKLDRNYSRTSES